jgi:hypothetical protein
VSLFACPKCRAALRTADGNGGAAATCPRCRQRLRVPVPPPTEDVTAERPARPRRRPVPQPHPGTTLASWLGQRFLGWLLGVVGLVLLNLLVCGGYLGWIYLHSSSPLRGLTDGKPVSAAGLAHDYLEDPAGADAKYRGRPLAVTGVIAEVGRDADRTPYLVLDAEEGAPRVQCFFDGADEDDAADVARLRPGQWVTVHGRCEGKKDRVRLRDCTLAE